MSNKLDPAMNGEGVPKMIEPMNEKEKLKKLY